MGFPSRSLAGSELSIRGVRLAFLSHRWVTHGRAVTPETFSQTVCRTSVLVLAC